MRNSGRDPTRRNRNIGTAKQGHGADNRDRIPDCWHDSNLEWHRAKGAQVVKRTVWGRTLPIMVEPTYADHFHACTPDDIARVLNRLPRDHINSHEEISGIEGVILRQPTRKEQQLNGVWGRIYYGMTVGSRFGPVIQLPAQAYPMTIRWPRHLSPDYQEELSRLQKAASSTHFDGRVHHFQFDLDTVRSYQLFHSLPHEVGHWVDMLEKVERPLARDPNKSWTQLWERYFQRPSSEREAYAHRYAEEAVTTLTSPGDFPFERMMEREWLTEEGLNPDDFLPASQAEAEP